MKNPLSVFLFLLAVFVWPSISSFAQANKQLPLFNMALSNGRHFNAAEIPKGRPVILIYFDPECDHCHTLMNDFFKRTADFKSAEIMLVTFKPLAEVQAFAQAYQTHRYPNIKVGTEGTGYFLRNFYRLQNLPFVALYGKANQLIATYQKKVSLEALQKEIKKIERPS